MGGLFQKLKKHQFLFEELVKRDFKKKYKNTVLGMGWSLLSPLLMLLVMRVIFGYFFSRSIPHFTIYLFCGNLIFTYYNQSTHGGMRSLLSNAGIFTKVNVPKYLFLLSQNVSAFINFLLTLVIFFLFVFIDGLEFGFHFLSLLYPICTLVVFNIGVGMILSALYVFFRDIQYLYDVFIRFILYCSAIFYRVPDEYAEYFLLNPVYVHIKYFRTVVLEGHIPDLRLHLLCLVYALIVLLMGAWIYKKYNHKFLYYV